MLLENSIFTKNENNLNVNYNKYHIIKYLMSYPEIIGIYIYDKWVLLEYKSHIEILHHSYHNSKQIHPNFTTSLS